MMAVRKPASLLLLLAFAIPTLAYFSCQTSAVAVGDSLGVHGRRLLYQSVDSRVPRQAHAFFSKVGTDRVKKFSGNKHFWERSHDLFPSRVSANLQAGEDSDYGPPSVNRPIHVDPPGTSPVTFNSAHETLNRQLDTSANFHEDYAPARTHPPIDYHDYPPPYDFVPRKTWSSEASFMHATLPAPTMIYHPENLSGG